MIFVTVGEQLPFDRLIKTVDHWARDARQEVIAQIGGSRFRPHFMQAKPSFPPNEYRRLFASSDLVIAHAGMGTIISAVENNKPLLIIPRHQQLGEHRTDHQLATAQRFSNLPLVTVAWDESELKEQLQNWQALLNNVQFSQDLWAGQELLNTVRKFVVACC